MRPIFLVENFYSKLQFPDHTISAEEEATDNEAFRVANGRRSARDKWAPTTLNSASYVDAACDRIRAADCIALDRGHNLAGYDIELRGSNQAAFTTYESVLDLTLPTYTAPGDIDDALGVRTEEGAWIKRFDMRAYKYWRLYVDAMGAGLKPNVVGLWLGLSFSPQYLDMPWNEDGADLVVKQAASESGWLGRGVANKVRSGTITLALSSFQEYDTKARYHLQGLYGEGFPMWIVFDEAQADRAVLAELPAGGLHFDLAGGTHGYRVGQIAWREREAATA